MSVTFQKRQKEQKRLEKQKAKAERREQRKIAKNSGETEIDDSIATPSEIAELQQQNNLPNT